MCRKRTGFKPGDEVGKGGQERDEERDREREANFKVEQRSPCLGRCLPRGVFTSNIKIFTSNIKAFVGIKITSNIKACILI